MYFCLSGLENPLEVIEVIIGRVAIHRGIEIDQVTDIFFGLPVTFTFIYRRFTELLLQLLWCLLEL